MHPLIAAYIKRNELAKKYLAAPGPVHEDYKAFWVHMAYIFLMEDELRIHA